jgi:hypothetical protein
MSDDPRDKLLAALYWSYGKLKGSTVYQKAPMYFDGCLQWHERLSANDKRPCLTLADVVASAHKDAAESMAAAAAASAEVPAVIREDSVMTDSVVGVWLLRACYLENVKTGERIEPFGANPKGVFIFHPDGRAVVVITPAEQTKPVTEADQAEAFQKLLAYSGIYRVEPPDRLVIAVDIAWFEPWVGSEQARRFVVKGDTLEIVGEPTKMPLTGDATIIGVLSWMREKPTK